MTLRQSQKGIIRLPFLVTLICAGLLFAQVGLAEVSLQEVYNNAGPGGGYDKLLELDPQEIYIGDLLITGPYHEVCIHGNGALVVPDGNFYAILVYESLLDVDHLVIEASIIGLFYSNHSCGTVKNNTIAGAADCGIRSTDIYMPGGLEIFNNIIVGCGYGIYANEDYLPQYIAYNDLWNNPGGDYMMYCG
ncbi:MAG: hypothetical protein ACE5JC_03250 [Candidatus Zixiibacteriota bacterium]